MTGSHRAENTFYLVLATSLALKLMLSAWLPVTGDEAYFTLWGKYPDYGYYDHPPMLGWWLTAQLWLGDALWWLRLPSVLVTSAIGWIIYSLLREKDTRVAAWVASLYLLAPINLLGVVIANDTPMLLFSFLSALAFHRAQHHDHPGWYAASGVLLGLAFLAKFFAGVLGLAYAVYVLLFVRRGFRPWIGIALVALAAVPGVAVNLTWNYDHCWNNYLFNLFNRTQHTGLSLGNAGIYLLILGYAMTPPVVYYLYRSRRVVTDLMRGRDGLFLALFTIGIALFAVVAVRQPFGLHWLLVFYPFLFLGLAHALDPLHIRFCFRFMLPFAAVHVLIAVALLWVPLSLFRPWTEAHQFLVFGKHTDEVLAQLDKFGGGYLYATDNYSVSATAAYGGRRRVIVFGAGSYHGRQDDQLTDFRELDGRNILVLHFAEATQKPLVRYFDKVTFREISVRGARYYVALGQGFRYRAYRDGVLTAVRSNYYRIPRFLPVGECYMFDRYFDKEREGSAG